MAENVRLLIVDPDINQRTDLKRQLTRAGVVVVGEADYGAEALTLAQTVQPDAVALGWMEPSTRSEQTLESLALSLPSSPLIVYSAIEDLSAARRAYQAGAHDYLLRPVSSKDFLDSLNKALHQLERRRLSESGNVAEAVGEGIVVSLFGAKGGIGKTTMSTNLAVALSKARNESVALVDIDTRFGDVALVLDLQTDKNIGDAVHDIDTLDRFNINSYLATHASGIRVLPAPKRPSEWRQVRPAHVEKIIKLLAQTHDFVLLDTPGFFTELVGVALDMSDLVLLVTTVDLSSIKDCSMALDMLAKADYPMERVKLVVNQPTTVNTVSTKQIAEVTGLEVFWTVPFDKSFIKAGQVGMPLILHRPQSKGARSIVDLSYAITGGKRETRLFRRNAKTEVRSQAALSLTQGPVGD